MCMWGCFGLGFFAVSQSNFFNHRGGSHREGLEGCGCLLLPGWRQRWQHLCPTGGGCHLEQGKAAGPEVATGMSLTLCPCMAHHRQTQHPSTAVTMRTQTDSHLSASSEVNQEAGSPERMPCCHLLPPSPSSRPRTAGAEGRAPALVLIFPHRFSGRYPQGEAVGLRLPHLTVCE